MDAIDQSVAALVAACDSTFTVSQRARLCNECIEAVWRSARQWGESAAEAKGSERYYAAELLTGPNIVLRQLRLAAQTLEAIDKIGRPRLPGRVRRLADGRLRIPVFPTAGLYDAVFFRGVSAEVHMPSGIDASQIHGRRVESITAGRADELTAVLGAGNVAAIPLTDCLSKILFDNQRTVLKLNPVNDYLHDVFAACLSPLIDADLLRIVTGSADVGQRLIHHAEIDRVHITGSDAVHDAIVWGQDAQQREQNRANQTPVLTKPITSELGNVTPWMIVPGHYSKSELRSQAAHMAASITNNASFNCIATKVILTWRSWPQRQEFLNHLQQCLLESPLLPSYYPGAEQRYQRFAKSDVGKDENGCLPWTLLTDQSIEQRPELFEQESFVCVCTESPLAGASPVQFLAEAVEFANQRLTGSLAASVTFPRTFRREHRLAYDRAISSLRYGTVCVNQWSGLAYSTTSTPWGAYPGGTIDQAGSGIGYVHNSYLLEGFEKSVLEGPLVSFPKPVWFPSHRRSGEVAEQLLGFYHDPSVFKLPKIGLAALMG